MSARMKTEIPAIPLALITGFAIAQLVLWPFGLASLGTFAVLSTGAVAGRLSLALCENATRRLHGAGRWGLLRCVWHFGWRRGWGCWKILRLCDVWPDMALLWAEVLENEALSHEANGVTKYAPHLRAFSAGIRRHHAAFKATGVSSP